MRADDCLVDVWLTRGEKTLAVATARKALDITFLACGSTVRI